MAEIDYRRELIQALTIIESIQDVLDGKEPSDFMLSFPIIREIYDLYNVRSPEQKKDEKRGE